MAPAGFGDAEDMMRETECYCDRRRKKRRKGHVQLQLTVFGGRAWKRAVVFGRTAGKVVYTMSVNWYENEKRG